MTDLEEELKAAFLSNKAQEVYEYNKQGGHTGAMLRLLSDRMKIMEDHITKLQEKINAMEK